MIDHDLRRALRANRDTLVLLDRALAEARESDAALAEASRDVDSFLSYTLMAVGSDGKAGVLLENTGSVARTFSGLFSVDSDAAFVVTQICGVFRSSSLAYLPLSSLSNTNIRFTDVASGRELTRVEQQPRASDPVGIALPTLFTGAFQIAPNAYQLSAPFTLPRNAAVRADVSLVSASAARAMLALVGYKVFGD
jgi:hypothetical protein